MDLVAASALALDLMTEHGLASHGWTFGWDSARKRYGCCRYGTKQITMSRYLTAERTDEAVRQTLLHEIAHALTPGAKHGAVWLRKARSIGYTGGRCSNDETPISDSASTYVYVCNSCDFTASRIKKPRTPLGTHTHICRKCRSQRKSGNISIIERRHLLVTA